MKLSPALVMPLILAIPLGSSGCLDPTRLGSTGEPAPIPAEPAAGPAEPAPAPGAGPVGWVTVRQLALFSPGTCAVRADGTLWCWDAGGGSFFPAVPTQVPGIEDAVGFDLSAFPVALVVLHADRRVSCLSTQTGQWRHAWAEGVERAIAVSANAGLDNQGCALIESGEVVCWELEALLDPKPVLATRVEGTEGATALVRGAPCATTAAGAIVCWGRLASPAGGVRTIAGLPPIRHATFVRRSYYGHNMELVAVDTEGTVWAWDPIMTGEGGLSAKQVAPVAVQSLPGATEIEAGLNHSCARSEAGTVWCWGENANGQLGLGFASSVSTPLAQEVPGLKAQALSVERRSSCAIDLEGRLLCWGGGSHQETTDYHVWEASLPVLTEATRVTVGPGFACGVTEAGEVGCWGLNGSGELGVGDQIVRSVPTQVSTLAGAVDVVAGLQFACALDDQGQVDCWGANHYHQLGTDVGSLSTTPVTVPLPAPATRIVAGWDHACALTEAGAVWCWGAYLHYSSLGALPYDTGLEGVIDLAAGGGQAYAIDAEGALWGWGNNLDGQVTGLPDVEFAKPRKLELPTHATAVHTGRETTCVQLEDGSTRCWGDNAEVASHAMATGAGTPVLGGPDPCQLTPAGQLRCSVWVGGPEGQSYADLPAPPWTVTQAALSSGIACVVTAGREVRCVGQNLFGELGHHGGLVWAPQEVVIP
jgi:alpha-tubulin suppressor-like RCC1 family protein